MDGRDDASVDEEIGPGEQRRGRAHEELDGGRDGLVFMNVLRERCCGRCGAP